MKLKKAKGKPLQEINGYKIKHTQTELQIWQWKVPVLHLFSIICL
jgi:hypothetical protein